MTPQNKPEWREKIRGIVDGYEFLCRNDAEPCATCEDGYEKLEELIESLLAERDTEIVKMVKEVRFYDGLAYALNDTLLMAEIDGRQEACDKIISFIEGKV